MEVFLQAITSMTGATFEIATAFGGWVMETPIVLCGVAMSVIGFAIAKATNAMRGV